MESQPQMTAELRKTIEYAWKNRINLPALSSSAEIREAIFDVIDRLNTGTLRAADKTDGQWLSVPWVRQAALLFMKMRDSAFTPATVTGISAIDFWDRELDRFSSFSHYDFVRHDLSITPPVIARRGSFIGKGVQLEPSFIDIAAYVDDDTAIGAWVSVGAGAQIGKGVHLSSGVTIEGSLHSFHARPAIIEDNCHIGANSSISESVIVEQNSILAAGVHIDLSTPVFDQENSLVLHGLVPAGSVVTMGTVLSENRKFSIMCAIIIRRIDARTRANTPVHELLRHP